MPEWGGPRPGAGRKPKQPGSTRVTLSTRISEQSSERLRAYARRSGKALGEVLDEMVTFVDQQPAFEAQAGTGAPAGLWLTQPAFIDLLPAALREACREVWADGEPRTIMSGDGAAALAVRILPTGSGPGVVLQVGQADDAS